ncbi:fumarylacetoacetate hydrolase family protein (plasmid) [Rhizobium sp. CC1099]|uniref:fumarylacetoacetate hydrolase family protein n=1 Tax=Rhizobium sp. CC1099 TaxID=3039160 RepID=UPI0024B18AB2|nr:fumarylacetoacetate hydrolase family protein [Rhizobium sp. CC1099]WFU91358.1 fumarylacetoacetate hydrolase family protein [Rhizobium sp. CC1099]
MRFVRFELEGNEGLAVENNGSLRGLLVNDPEFPGTLDALVGADGSGLAAAGETLACGKTISREGIRYLPPFSRASKILCVGLNYHDHSAESGYAQPKYPTVFARFNSSLIGHGDDIIRPEVSDTLDFEGELVAVIGKGGFKISEQDALGHVIGYSIFNDGSIREYQHATPQWTIGKNFDSTGAFGPVFVTADELPAGCKGLFLETRLNGQVVQRANIDDMVFSVASLVSILSQTMTLEPGDVIVTGTPAGVGAGRKPPLWMKSGDVCEVEIDRIGLLVNSIRDEVAVGREAA